jgi:hypothetical protein
MKGTPPTRFLHDFREYRAQPEVLRTASAELYTGVDCTYATIARLGALTSDDVKGVLRDAVDIVRARGLTNLSVICDADTDVARHLAAQRCEPWENLHCTMVEEKPPSRVCFTEVSVLECKQDGYLDHLDALASVMYECIADQVRIGKIAKRELKPQAEYSKELRRYADYVGVGRAWIASSGDSTVGFSMCSLEGDDIEDTLGIGAYCIPKLLLTLWSPLVDSARMWLAGQSVQARITTWGEEIRHYKGRQMQSAETFQILDVPID